MNTTKCPTCGHNNGLYESLQGTLGALAHLRCRCCGTWWHMDVADLPTDDDEPEINHD